MSNDQPNGEILDGWVFTINRNKFPAEELAKYAGQHVAWSFDGTRIMAAGKDDAEVEGRLRAAGIDPERVVFSYVDGPDDPALL